MKKITNFAGKINFEKEDGSLVSDIWFDSVCKWHHYEENKIDIWGWEGMIYLEEPIKTEGTYPYSVFGEIHKFSNEGELLEIFKTHCGLSGI